MKAVSAKPINGSVILNRIAGIANLLICALIAILVTIFDFWIQIHGVKKFGGGKKAVNGSIVGLILEYVAESNFSSNSPANNQEIFTEVPNF